MIIVLKIVSFYLKDNTLNYVLLKSWKLSKLDKQFRTKRVYNNIYIVFFLYKFSNFLQWLDHCKSGHKSILHEFLYESWSILYEFLSALKRREMLTDAFTATDN